MPIVKDKMANRFLDFANASPYLRKIVMHGLSLPMELWV